MVISYLVNKDITCLSKHTSLVLVDKKGRRQLENSKLHSVSADKSEVDFTDNNNVNNNVNNDKSENNFSVIEHESCNRVSQAENQQSSDDDYESKLANIQYLKEQTEDMYQKKRKTMSLLKGPVKNSEIKEIEEECQEDEQSNNRGFEREAEQQQ